MNPILKVTIALTLALFLAVPASGQSLGQPSHVSETMITVALSSPALAEQGQGIATNPPARVRQPSARTRIITAIAFVGGFAGLALLFSEHGRGGR